MLVRPLSSTSLLIDTIAASVLTSSESKATSVSNWNLRFPETRSGKRSCFKLQRPLRVLKLRPHENAGLFAVYIRLSDGGLADWNPSSDKTSDLIEFRTKLKVILARTLKKIESKTPSVVGVRRSSSPTSAATKPQ